MKTDLSKYNNDWFQAQIGGSFLKRTMWYFFNIFFFKNPLITSSGLKCYLLRLFGATIGENVLLKPSLNIKYPWKLSIGSNSWIGEGTWIDNLAQVSIGSNVCISQGAMLLTGNHDYSQITFDLIVKPITVEDGVWIGAGSIVCPGIVCKSHSVLSVRSVATKDLEEYTVYQGNPALPVKSRIIKVNE
jgi:putative colanic acid biosynthesis acetyltransferase WcaF